MAEKSDTTTSFKFNEEAIKQKFKTLEAAVNAQQGKRGFNPFVFINEKVNPLIQRFIGTPNTDEKPAIAPERTKELQDAIMALPDAPPQIFQAEEPKPVPQRILTA